jgi:hypothetical protein
MIDSLAFLGLQECPHGGAYGFLQLDVETQRAPMDRKAPEVIKIKCMATAQTVQSR